MYRIGQHAWPSVSLTATDFVAHLGSRLRAESDGSDIPNPVLDKIYASDLYLACGCARGLPPALAAFDSAYLSQVPAMVGHLDSSPTLVD